MTDPLHSFTNPIGARYLCPRCHAIWPRGGPCPSDGVTLIHDRTGQLLADRYQYRRPLGRGAMGLVWEADQVALHRRVAIKITSFTDEETNGRFMRGAAIMAKMSHPNIARIHDFGICPGPAGEELFLVMERLDGAPLARFIAQGPLDPTRAVSAAAQTLAALEHLHRKGYIHRDVKPANLFVTTLDDDSFVLKLLDFGIARPADRAHPHDPAATQTHTGTVSLRVTQPMRILGTPEYMAPEQILGQPLDHRVDLYATGVMLFSLLTGRLPFTGPDRHALYAAHLRNPTPRLSEHLARPPASARSWDGFFGVALAKSSHDRFATAADMRQALLAMPAPTDLKPHAPDPGQAPESGPG